jgi:hypothetical protein
LRSIHTDLKAVPPVRASNSTTSSRPMTWKNALGLERTKNVSTSQVIYSFVQTHSMPFADVKSVPVFFNDCMAARIPCTAATQETSEKTGVENRST